jgi:alpha-beta hydrolase superfamily lysophospholipase
MILLRDFALFVLPGLVAAGGWLYALDLRKQARSGRASDGRELQRTVASFARTAVRKCS